MLIASPNGEVSGVKVTNWATSEGFSLFAKYLQLMVKQLPVSRVSYVAFVAIAAWFLLLLADLVWVLIPSSQDNVMMLPINSSQSTKPLGKRQGVSKDGLHIESMQAWHLFGLMDEAAIGAEEPVAADEEVDIKASETRLQLTLLGVMASDVSTSGYAVISHQSKSELYKVGDKIPGGRDVKLSRVFSDRVIIDNHGNYEALYLYDESLNKNKVKTVAKSKGGKSTARKKKGVVDNRGNEDLRKMANDYRQQLLKNPMSLADAIKISIAKDAEGNIIGYRVRPGRHRKQFTDFGLKSGDIVTSINGVELDDPSKAMELYRDMRDATEATVVVSRGEEELTLMLGL